MRIRSSFRLRMFLSTFAAVFAAVLTVTSFSSRAQAFIELNTFYFSEAESTASTASSNRTFIEGTLGYRVDKAGNYLIGWGVASHSQAVTGTTSSTYTSLQMGPRFLWLVDKSKNWSFGLAYYIVTTGNYDAGAGSEIWKGTALHFDSGYNLPVSESAYLAVRLNYSLATYSEKLVGSTTYSTVSYTKNFIYPSLAAFYIF